MVSNVVPFPLTTHVAVEAFARQLHHHTRWVPEQRADRIVRHCAMHLSEFVAHGIPEEAARKHAVELAHHLGEWMSILDAERQQATG